MRTVILIVLIGIIGSTRGASLDEVNANSSRQIVFGSTNNPDSLLFKQANAILHHAFNQLGYQFTLRHLPNKRSLVWANTDKLDGIAFRVEALSTQYPNLVKVDEVLFSLEQFVFSKKAIDVDGWQSLSAYTIAYERGTKFIEQQKHLLTQLIPVSDSTQAFQMVFHGRADLTITSEKTGQAILSKHQASFNQSVKQQLPALTQIKLYSYLHKKHQALAEQLAQQLKAMKANGEFQRLLTQYQ